MKKFEEFLANSITFSESSQLYGGYTECAYVEDYCTGDNCDESVTVNDDYGKFITGFTRVKECP